MRATLGYRRRAVLAILAGGAALALPAPASAALAPPVQGKTVQATPVSGQVYVTAPHGKKTLLSKAADVPVKSVFDVTSASVRITAANGEGGTYSGTFGKGTFEVLQSARGDATTEIKLVTNLSCATASGKAVEARHHPRRYRQLSITAGNGFLVLGLSASATSSSASATYTLVDQCDGTHIVDQGGKVLAKRKHGMTDKLEPGQSETSDCANASKGRSYCLFVFASPKDMAFTFGLGLINYSATKHWKVCFTTPKGKQPCFSGPVTDQQGFQFGVLDCTLNDGPGEFAVRYYVGSTQVGPVEHFAATQPRQAFQGSDACSSKPTGF